MQNLDQVGLSMWKIYVLVMISFTGCRDASNSQEILKDDVLEDYIVRKVDIEDPLGNLYLQLPMSMNKFLKWYCPLPKLGNQKISRELG